MSAKIRQISAGATKLTSGCQGGGDKLAGLPPTATGEMLSMPFAWRAALGGIAGPGNGRANGNLTNKFLISRTNQLSRVSGRYYMTGIPSDGVNNYQINEGIRRCRQTTNRLSMLNVKDLH